jgi:hypothetical protein
MDKAGVTNGTNSCETRRPPVPWNPTPFIVFISAMQLMNSNGPFAAFGFKGLANPLSPSAAIPLNRMWVDVLPGIFTPPLMSLATSDCSAGQHGQHHQLVNDLGRGLRGRVTHAFEQPPLARSRRRLDGSPADLRVGVVEGAFVLEALARVISLIRGSLPTSARREAHVGA